MNGPVEIIPAVVAAVIRDFEGRFYVQQRPPGREMEGKWEFPGGRVELGETLESALVREIKEELGVQVRPSRYIASVRLEYIGIQGPFFLHFYACRLLEASHRIRALDGQTFAWVKPSELGGYDFLRPDLEVFQMEKGRGL